MKETAPTLPSLIARKGLGPKISMVTAYDATMAHLLDRAGVDILLVGDSLGMVVQGERSTLPVTLKQILYHTQAVCRGAQRAQVVADLPFLSYQISVAQAMKSAGTILKRSAAASVKLEGGVELSETVRALTRIGIPVMGHVGLMPQRVHAMGGYKIQGRSPEAAERVMQDAVAIAEAGAYAIVLEGIPGELARKISEKIPVPTIGIGSGPHCDGQVLVCYDLLGMYEGLKPKFVKNFAQLGTQIDSAVKGFIREVQEGSFPGAEHSYS